MSSLINRCEPELKKGKQMKKEIWPKSANLVLFCCCCALVQFAALSLCGCAQIQSYSNESLFPTEVQSVRVEMFENQSFRRGVEYDLSEALAKRIEAETPYKIITSKDRADTVISGQITNISEAVLSTERQTGRPMESEVHLQAVVTWKNLNNAELLLDSRTVSASATYSIWQNQSFDYASSRAANNLAEKIVEMMEKEW